MPTNQTAPNQTMPRVLLLAALLLAAPLAGQDESLVIPLSNPGADAHLEVNLTYGSIHVEPHDDPRILVEMRMAPETDTSDSDPPREDGLRRIANPTNLLRAEENDNHVRLILQSRQRVADLKIRVPRRTSLDLRTVNAGEITVRGVEGHHAFGHSNGDITALEISGAVVAKTVGGRIQVEMSAVDPEAPMSLTTWNGEIDITLPRSIQADLRMRSAHGELLTDFNLETRTETRRLEQDAAESGYKAEIANELLAELGGGGPEIVLKTYNGDILIRRAR